MTRKGKGRGRGRGSEAPGSTLAADQPGFHVAIGLNRPQITNTGDRTPAIEPPRYQVSNGIDRAQFTRDINREPALCQPGSHTPSVLNRQPLTEAASQDTRGRGRGRAPNVSPNHEVNVRQQLNNLRAPQQFESLPLSSPSTGNTNVSPSSTSSLPAALKLSNEKIDHIKENNFIPTSNVNASKMAKRPGYGVVGRPIKLFANYFVMKYAETHIFHYDVEINSLDQKMRNRAATKADATKAGISNLEHQLNKNVGKAKCKEVIAEMVKSKSLQPYNPVYDGNKNIYTSTPLPITEKKIVIVSLKVAEKTRQYEVVIQPVEKDDGSNMISLKPMKDMKAGNVDKVPQEILMALNTIMNHRDVGSNQIQVGRSFFFLNQADKIPLGEGIEIWFGYNQSVHFTEKGPALILNLAAKAFHKAGPVIEYANDVLRCDITRSPNLTNYQITRLNNALKGVRVEVTHLRYPRRYAIQGLSRSSANELKLDINGTHISVAQYFQEKYKRLRFPNLPCLHMRSNNNQTYIPLENCVVCEGQPKLGKLSAGTANTMIKKTAVTPVERFQAITSSADTVKKQSGVKMNNFNLCMDIEPMKVNGRVIEPPFLTYLEDVAPVKPDIKGVWRMDGKRFFRAPKSKSWILLSFVGNETCSRNCLDNFARVLSNTGRKAGLDFGQLLEVKQFGRNQRMRDALVYAQESQATFAVAVLSKRESYHSYEELKFLSDYHLGFVTQCMDEKVLNRFNEQIACNVCLKINTKLGGVNHVMKVKPEIFAKPVIVFGADAVHSPRGSGCPSIAAVVGSLDAYPSKYKLACRVQDNPDGNKISQEIIVELKEMVESILNAFYHTTRGKHPEKLIFYRDGVSEGQFEKVLESEVSQIQEACKAVIGAIIPITFIIVQKRHQTRFRPQDPRSGVGRGGNVPPGTTVDTDVTHPRFFDFFLCSHEGIQGTSKPAKYTVLHDDNNFQADPIQKLSYHLCHMYVRCNRSVSIPAPVMYADLAAYRAKKYADWHIQQQPPGSASSSESISRLPEHVRDAINKMENFPTSMFFV